MNDIKGIIEDVEKSSLVSSKVIKKVIKIIGQEEWNNIHDEESDICTTTGELIITLKGIAELEKENAEMNKQLTKAKEIIKYLCGMVRELNKPNVQLTDVDCSLSEAEQFVSKVEQ